MPSAPTARIRKPKTPPLTISAAYSNRRRINGDEENESYWEDEFPDDNASRQQRRPFDRNVDMDEVDSSSNNNSDSPGFYNVYFEGPPPAPEPLEWELCQDGSTWVLLPPTHVTEPRSIIHFVGGTFFGSSPKLWYRTLLEGVVRATHSAVVATPIPVTLWKNPLQHVQLSRALQRQFQQAYRNVLVDEYGADHLANVPVIGVGHSLGARLLTVLATLDPPSFAARTTRTTIPPYYYYYKSYILISFTNYGAAASIPGMQMLLQQSRKLEEEEQPQQQPQQNVRLDSEEDVYAHHDGDTQRRRRPSRPRTRDLYDYDDDEEEEEWEELMSELQEAFREQTHRIRNILTPSSKQLEFHPNPDQLWRAIKDDRRYRIPQTLLVQFDEDEIDQSPRLADCLLQANNDTAFLQNNNNNTTTSSLSPPLDLKYAHLRGVHLTPISVAEEASSSASATGDEWPSRASQALLRWMRGRAFSRVSADALRDLRQSIVRYIMDVVTAPE